MELSLIISRLKQAAKSKFLVKTFSSEVLALLMDVDVDRLRKWERGAKPNSDDDRQKLRKFLEWDNLDDIPMSHVSLALDKIRKSGSGYIIEAKKTDTKTPTSDDADETVTEPIMYQEVVRALIKTQDELIESAKAQRRMSDAQIEISKALLDERQSIKEAAKATQEASKTLHKEIAEMRSNWMKLEKSVNGSHLKLRALEQLAVNHSADLPKKKPTEIQNLLSGISERLGQSKTLSSTKQGGN